MLREKIGQLYVGGMNDPFATTKVTKEMSSLDGKIIECRFEFDRKNWTFMRQRTDKSFPNSYNTAMCKFLSIINLETILIIICSISIELVFS